MSLVQSVLEKYGTPIPATDRTDTSPSVSIVSESPKRFKGKKRTSVSCVSESGGHFEKKTLAQESTQKRPGDPLTKLTEPPFGSSESRQISEFCGEPQPRVAITQADLNEFSRYEAVLRTGVLVICRRCAHYKGPHEKALGWCDKLDTDTAPDVPFTCGAASRA